MRRFFCAAAVLALAATCPVSGWAGDREIAEQIINRLKVQRDAGTLKGFKLDLKVEEGVVLLKGKVSETAQKTAVLAAAEGLDGITKVVDEITVGTTATSENSAAGFSFRQALEGEAARSQHLQRLSGDMEESQGLLAAGLPQPLTEDLRGAYTESANPGDSDVAPASANEDAATSSSDEALTTTVIGALGRAQQEGHLRGFGVDVTNNAGEVMLRGRASTAAHKALILDLVRHTPGVRSVVDDISVFTPKPLDTAAAAPVSPAPLRTAVTGQGSPLEPVAVQRVAHPLTNPAGPGGPVGQAAPMPTRVAANYNMAGIHGGGMHGGVVHGGGMPGQPMPVAPYAGGQAAPRYDQPYLPNYAWPGYAAYPNYAALSYPQQYSPSAWPYIGPFYPYPQVPLGWRKVSLEWDDGWWFLDFTDRNGRH